VAEILIQRKRRRRVFWPWLLGLLLLVLLPWPFLDDRNEPPATRGPIAQRDARTTDTAAGTIAPAVTAPSVAAPSAAAPSAAAPSAAAPSAAAPPTAESTLAPAATPSPGATSFERFIEATEPRADDRAHREYTANGLRRLADDLQTLGASDAGVRAIRLNADSVMSSARRSAHPDYARAAFLAAVREIDALGGRHAVAVDTARLRTAAWAIEPNAGLLAQRAKVRSFFETARDALRSLSRRR
jgi:hypothetical protein